MRASLPISAGGDRSKQARRVKPRRIERLQHVVARRRQEPRLAQIGFVGFRFGNREFLRSRLHAPFKVLIGPCQRVCCGFPFSNVGIGHDDAAKWHGVGADLDDAPLDRALVEDLHRHLILCNPVRDEFLDCACSVVNALRHEAHNLIERDADAAELQKAASKFPGIAGSSK